MFDSKETKDKEAEELRLKAIKDKKDKDDKESIDSRSELEFLQGLNQKLKNISLPQSPIAYVVDAIDKRILKVGSGHVKPAEKKDK